jgi:hypothetical protein
LGAAGFDGSGTSVGSITDCVSASVLSTPIESQSMAASTTPQFRAALHRR